MLTALAAVLLAAEGRPLFYWGTRPAVVEAVRPPQQSVTALVLQVHAAVDGTELVLRFTFDRPVREALRLPDGAPVSGRLRGVLDIDVDDDRASGLDAGAKDLRTGSDRRVEVATRYMGEDRAEGRKASVEVTARLFSLARDGRRRTLWREDDSGDAQRLSWHGDAVELRIPQAEVGLLPRARFILSDGELAWDGRL